MQFFDAHTHLNHSELYTDRKDHIQFFIDAWGIGLVNIGVDHTYNTRGIEIANYAKQLFTNTIIKTTIGFHPYEVASEKITQQNRQEKFQEMKLLYTEDNKEYIVAIGEIGIDTYRPDTDQTLVLQKEVFRQQCEWARTLNLPIVIHSRANRQATHEILQKFTDLSIYFHCRPYGPDEIKIIKETYPDFYIGFCGNISYPKADNIRKSLRYLVYENEDYPDYIISGKWVPSYEFLVPRASTNNQELGTKNLLIETDAPYLPPQSHRWQQNIPALVKENYMYISSLLWQDISSQVVENSQQYYNLWN